MLFSFPLDLLANISPKVIIIIQENCGASIEKSQVIIAMSCFCPILKVSFASSRRALLPKPSHVDSNTVENYWKKVKVLQLKSQCTDFCIQSWEKLIWLLRFKETLDFFIFFGFSFKKKLKANFRSARLLMGCYRQNQNFFLKKNWTVITKSCF